MCGGGEAGGGSDGGGEGGGGGCMVVVEVMVLLLVVPCESVWNQPEVLPWCSCWLEVFWSRAPMASLSL